MLRRRLALLGDTGSLRWLRPPPPGTSPTLSGGDEASDPPPAGHSALAEEWDRRHASTDRLFRAEPDQTLVEVVTPLHPGRAVGLGAGEGRYALWLAAHGRQVTAVDLSRRALARLDERHGSSDVPEPGTDLVLWARRPQEPIRPVS